MTPESQVVALPPPDITPLNRPYWDGIAAGYLQFQRCEHCGLATLPPRDACPRCLRAGLRWERASGNAKLVSWIVYHHAFHPAFAARLPYTVAVIELDEGPRLISNLTGVGDPEKLSIDMAVVLVIECENGFSIPRFRICAER